MATKEFQVRHGLIVGNTANVLVANSITTNVGIGTATPGYALDVVGSVNTANLLINSVPLTSSFASSNAWANTVGSAANVYSETILQANVAAANAWANNIGVVANNYASTILQANVAAANAWTNTVFGFANTKFVANNDQTKTIVLAANTYVTNNFVVALNGATQLDLIGEMGEFAHNINSYAQLHIHNANTGTLSSGDFVITADVGTDTTDYMDIGVTGSNYSDPNWTIGAQKDGYIYMATANLAIGSAYPGRYINFFTGGTLAQNEKARIEDSGNLLIGKTTSTVGQGVLLDVAGGINASGIMTTSTGNVMINRYTDSTIGFGVKLGVAGGINAATIISTGGNVYVQTGNVLINRGVNNSTLGLNVKLDIAGSANAYQYFANGIELTSISNSFTSTTIAGANAAVGSAANVYAGSLANTINANVALSTIQANNYAGSLANTLNANVAFANTIAILAYNKANTGGGSGIQFAANGNTGGPGPATTYGNVWLQSNTAQTYTYINTANGNYWVELGPYSYVAAAVTTNLDGGAASTNYGGITGVDAGTATA